MEMFLLIFLLILSFFVLLSVVIPVLASEKRKDAKKSLTSADSPPSMEDPPTQPEPAVNDCTEEPTPKFRWHEEEASFKSITEDQRAALLDANPKTKRLMSLQGIVIEVVGAYYRSEAAKEKYCSLRIGDKVSLKLDPDNLYDDTAVKVMAQNCFIGYVPKKYSNAIYYCTWMEKFDGGFVILPSKGASLSGLEIVLFLRPEEDVENELEQS